MTIIDVYTYVLYSRKFLWHYIFVKSFKTGLIFHKLDKLKIAYSQFHEWGIFLWNLQIFSVMKNSDYIYIWYVFVCSV